MNFDILLNLRSITIYLHAPHSCSSISTLSPLLSKKIIHKRFKPWVSCLCAVLHTAHCLCQYWQKDSDCIIRTPLYQFPQWAAVECLLSQHAFCAQTRQHWFLFCVSSSSTLHRNLPPDVLVSTDTFESFRNWKLREVHGPWTSSKNCICCLVTQIWEVSTGVCAGWLCA